MAAVKAPHRSLRALQDDKDADDKDADDKDDDKDDDSKEVDKDIKEKQKSGPKKRKFKIDEKKAEIKIEADADTSEKKKDKIEFEVKPNKDGMKVKVDYTYDKEEKKKDGKPKKHKKEKVDFEFKFTKVIEFKPKDGLDYYDWDETTVKKTMDLDSWKNLTLQQEDIPDAEDCKKFTIAAIAPKEATTESENVKITLKTSEKTEVEKEDGLAPNYFRVDVEINNWAYAETGTLLALVSDIKAPKWGKGGKKEVGDKEDGLNIDFDDYDKDDAEGEKDGEKEKPIGYFTWVKKAASTIKPSRKNARRLAEEEVEVISKVKDLADEDDDKSPSKKKKIKEIAFTFKTTQRSKKIFWDPEFGTGYEDTTEPEYDTALYVGMAVAACVLGVVGCIVVNKRSNSVNTRNQGGSSNKNTQMV